jgi:hypothetical protein
LAAHRQSRPLPLTAARLDTGTWGSAQGGPAILLSQSLKAPVASFLIMSPPDPALTSESIEEGDYWVRLQASQRAVCPGLVNHLASQAKGREAEEGRLAVVEFQQGTTIPAVRELRSSRSLTRYLDNTSGTASPPGTLIRRRIFVLEGLPKNFIEVLGGRLKIPPAFFSSHWVTGRYEGVMLNRMPRYCDPTSRCTLRMPRFHRAKIHELSSDGGEPIYRMNTPFRRRLSRATLFGDFNGLLSSTERASFWVRKEGESWDGMRYSCSSLCTHADARSSPDAC